MTGHRVGISMGDPREARPRIGISIGDPCGIGPEIAAKALLSPELRARVDLTIVGTRALLAWGCESIPGTTGRELRDAIERHPDSGFLSAGTDARLGELLRGRSCAEGGRVSAIAVRAGARAAIDGRIDALVTAPISKEAWRLAGVHYPGHTEMLAEEGCSRSFGMLFSAGPLRVMLATVHVPLASVPGLLTVEGLVEKLRLLRSGLAERFGVESPKIAVAGLNPHAGEWGLFGDEEDRIIRPALDLARAEGIYVSEPIPADVLFAEVYARDEYSAALAMYHDQGLIPVKQAAFGRSVNVTLGIPFIRTSPDHGTAFDIVGRGYARESSLVAAAVLAAEMTAVRAQRRA